MYPKGFLHQPFPYEILAVKYLHVICTMSIEIVFAVAQWEKPGRLQGENSSEQVTS